MLMIGASHGSMLPVGRFGPDAREFVRMRLGHERAADSRPSLLLLSAGCMLVRVRRVWLRNQLHWVREVQESPSQDSANQSAGRVATEQHDGPGKRGRQTGGPSESGAS